MKSSAPKGTKKKNNRLKPLSLIGIAVMLVMLLQMLILFAVSKTSEDSTPALVYYGTEIKLPEASLKTALSAAGFDFRIAEEGQTSFDRETVLLAVGENAFDVIKLYADDSNVLGFVIVDPKYPGNAAAEGINTFYPDKPVAIFSGKESWSSVSDLPDEALLYERMTGDDTVYGVPVTRGKYFSSTVYINNSVNRYLSFSGYKADGELLIFSPLFQNELAGYLSSVYHDHVGKIDTAKINMRLFFFILSVFAFITGLLLYMAPMNAVSAPKPGKGRALLLFITSVVLSAAIMSAAHLIKSVAILRVASLVPPLAVGLVSAVYVLAGNARNKEKLSFAAKGKALRPVFLILVTGGFVLLFALLTGDMTGTSRVLPIVLAACVADVPIRLVTYASVNPVHSLPEMLISLLPVPVIIVAACMSGNPAILIMIPALLFPCIFARAVRTVSDYPYMAAFAHGVLLALAVLLG